MRTPTQAVEEARNAGLQALSLTDHDTVEGIDEAIEAGKIWGRGYCWQELARTCASGKSTYWRT